MNFHIYVFYVIVFIQTVYIINLFGAEANGIMHSEDHSTLWESSEKDGEFAEEKEGNAAGINKSTVDIYGTNSSSSVSLEPSTLVYSRSPVCIPSLSQFLISNNGEEDLELLSIKSDSDQFYPVVFERQTLKSMESMTIQLFLPYYIESITATLTIASSEGDIIYHVRGEAIQNDYGVRPFTGLRIPRGMPYQQPIIISNPHNEPVRVREVFTTEDFLSLVDTTESNSGTDDVKLNADGTTDKAISSSNNRIIVVYWLWEIAPGESKEILHLSIVSQISGSIWVICILKQIWIIW